MQLLQSPIFPREELFYAICRITRIDEVGSVEEILHETSFGSFDSAKFKSFIGCIINRACEFIKQWIVYWIHLQGRAVCYVVGRVLSERQFIGFNRLRN